MRTAAVSVIYKKGLTMSAASRSKYTTGEITNFMSIDSQRFMEAVPYVNVLWATPVMFLWTVYFLYDLFGVSAFMGLVAILLCVPLNFLAMLHGKKLNMNGR